MTEVPAIIRDNAKALGLAVALVIAAFVIPHLLHPIPKNAFEKHEGQFQHDCVEGAFNGSAPQTCNSFATMRTAYGLEPMNELIAARAKMIDTARRLSSGDIDSRASYEKCLKEGTCAAVPVLPPHADKKSAESRATNAEFWHLVRGGDLTKAECDMMDICRAFVALKLIPQPLALSPESP